MKRIFACIMAAIMGFSLCSCALVREEVRFGSISFEVQKNWICSSNGTEQREYLYYELGGGEILKVINEINYLSPEEVQLSAPIIYLLDKTDISISDGNTYELLGAKAMKTEYSYINGVEKMRGNIVAFKRDNESRLYVFMHETVEQEFDKSRGKLDNILKTLKFYDCDKWEDKRLETAKIRGLSYSFLNDWKRDDINSLHHSFKQADKNIFTLFELKYSGDLNKYAETLFEVAREGYEDGVKNEKLTTGKVAGLDSRGIAFDYKDKKSGDIKEREIICFGYDNMFYVASIITDVDSYYLGREMMQLFLDTAKLEPLTDKLDGLLKNERFTMRMPSDWMLSNEAENRYYTIYGKIEHGKSETSLDFAVQFYTEEFECDKEVKMTIGGKRASRLKFSFTEAESSIKYDSIMYFVEYSPEETFIINYTVPYDESHEEVELFDEAARTIAIKW